MISWSEFNETWFGTWFGTPLLWYLKILWYPGFNKFNSSHLWHHHLVLFGIEIWTLIINLDLVVQFWWNFVSQTFVDLKSLRMRNLNETVVGYLNANSIRNEFDSFARQTTRNIGIECFQNQSLMKVFLPVNFYCMTTVPLSIFIGMGMVEVFCYIFGKIYHPHFYQWMKQYRVFFVETNLQNKKKWLLSCSYNFTKMQISNHFAELSKSKDLYHTKYEFLF